MTDDTLSTTCGGGDRFRGLATLDLYCAGIGLAGAEAAVAPLLPGDAKGEAECGPALCALLLAANPCTREEGWAGHAQGAVS